MKLKDIFESIQLDETAVRTFKKLGNKIRRYYRCTSGPRAGTYASSPAGCATRKDPSKVRHGKQVARHSEAVRVRKTKVTRRRSLSRQTKKINHNIVKHRPLMHHKKIKISNVSKSTVKSKKPTSPK